jgi:hypothetical protein
MKDREIEIVQELILKTGLDFYMADDEFSHYDAYNAHYIVEVKYRAKEYKTKVIEAAKLFNCLHVANLKDVMFLYVVSDPGGIYVYNMTDIAAENKLPKLERMMMPDKTEFGETKKIYKYIYELDTCLAAEHYIP